MRFGSYNAPAWKPWFEIAGNQMKAGLTLVSGRPSRVQTPGIGVLASTT
ncbi:hypothetical protein [Roseateles sp. P5_E1]